MTTALIIANILSFIGNTLFTLSTIIKSKRRILLFQSANHIISGVSEYMTEAYTGLVQEASCLLRNTIFLFLKTESTRLKLIITVIITIIAAALGVLFNILLSDGVWYGYLPVIGSLLYSTGVILAFVLPISALKAEVVLKIFLMINAIAWGMYGIIVKLYPIFIFNMLNIILCSIAIVRAFILMKKESSKVLE
ncbi:MAG: YgjV family protein [Acholeplasmatales bacterium]|nr:YgjV family protein [Acholeplasmatales bacterium]